MKKERTQQYKSRRALIILGVLALIYVFCLVGGHMNKGKDIASDDPYTYYEKRMDEALDTLVAKHFMEGTQVTERWDIEVIDRKSELQSEIEALETRAFFYSEIPDEMKSDESKERAAEVDARLSNLRKELGSLTQSTSSDAARIRRVILQQPDGDRYTAFQRIDGKCIVSKLLSIVILD